jgi:hypothetical protein
MTHEQRARRNTRLLVALGIFMSIAATAALAVRVSRLPGSPHAPATPAATPAQTLPRSAPSIDHSVVNRPGLEDPAETPGLSVAAYGA